MKCFPSAYFKKPLLNSGFQNAKYQTGVISVQSFLMKMRVLIFYHLTFKEITFLSSVSNNYVSFLNFQWIHSAWTHTGT